MKLLREDMERIEDAKPLELFAQGIRSKATLDGYTRTLRQVVCEFLEDVLEGTFEERVSQLVQLGRDEPKWTRDLLIRMAQKLRERTTLARDDPNYLNPASVSSPFKPIKKLFDMNDVVLQWKRIYVTFPELDNVHGSTGWTRDEIAAMLKRARNTQERALILLLASSGVRVGAIPDLNWGDLEPVYQVDGKLTTDPDGEEGEIACAALEVYRESSESYTTFVTPEALEALQEYGRDWSERRGRPAGPKDPMFISTKDAPMRVAYPTIQKRLGYVARKAGLRGEGKDGRRHRVPLMNGFRRFFNKTCKDAPTSDTTGSRIRTEYMMGHQGMGPLDKNYYKTNVLELAAEYVMAVPDLTIDDSDRLKLSNKRMSDNIQKMESEKGVELARMKEEVERMKKEMALRDKELVEMRSSLDPGGLGLVDALKNATDAGGVPGPVVESLTGMMRQLGESQEAALKEMQAKHDAEIAELRRALDRGASSKDGSVDAMGHDGGS